MHTHIHVGGPTASITMGGNFRPQPERTLVYGNGTEEDYNITKVWINEIMDKANLTEEQIELKDSILSNKKLTTKFFGPLVEDMVNPVNEENLMQKANMEVIETFDSGKTKKKFKFRRLPQFFQEIFHQSFSMFKIPQR